MLLETHFAAQSVKDTLTTVSALKGAATSLKAEHAKLDIGEIEDMQDDLADLMMDADEINELMGRSYGYVCVCVRVYVCTCVRVYVCVYACTRLRVYVCS